MKLFLNGVLSITLLTSALLSFAKESKETGIHVGVFKQEVAASFSMEDGLPSNDVLSIAVANNGVVYAGTAKGLCVYRDKTWSVVEGVPSQAITALAVKGDFILAGVGGALYEIKNDEAKKLADLSEDAITDIAASDDAVFAVTDHDFIRLGRGAISRNVVPLDNLLKDRNSLDHSVNLPDGSIILSMGPVAGIACLPDGSLAIASQVGLMKQGIGGLFQSLVPLTSDGRGWHLRDVCGTTYDSLNRLWFACPQGVGRLDGEAWSLYEGKDGLPYNDFTCMAAGEEGAVWFGTTKGAIRFDGKEWGYRQGRRWLPSDRINAIAVTPEGQAWFATPNGVGCIERRPMTLAEKAAFYEDEVEKYIKRTEYGYLSEVRLGSPGDRSEVIYSDSDNDGLWTSMYGAGECFAYAATKNPAAKERAKQAFEALRFLSHAPIGGEVEQQPGFVARTVVPTTEPDPNKHEAFTLEGMKRRRDHEDGRWKVYYPRWPLTKDKKYWYKTDTSSDELDGHFFFYPLYYDLVADTPREKERVREVVRAIADHLVRNDFCLVDHDGTPTRWAVYDPAIINQDFAWFAERGLNSLSILSYLAVAEHVTGDSKYGEASKMLIEKHSYHLNAMVTKLQRGAGSGNQSDDEMAFMSYYNLIKYTKDEELRNQMLFSFFNYWTIEYPEMNPFFNYAYAACANGETFTDPWGTYDLSPWDGWLEDSAATLTGFPLDRANWAHQNSHRLDVVPLPIYAGKSLEGPNRRGRGLRVNGKVLPVQERHFNHWNTDPWTLNYGGDGRELANGTVYLLPYYMGLYYGYIE